MTLVTQHGTREPLIRLGAADHESVATPLPERAHASARERDVEVLCHMRCADGRYLPSWSRGQARPILQCLWCAYTFHRPEWHRRGARPGNPPRGWAVRSDDALNSPTQPTPAHPYSGCSPCSAHRRRDLPRHHPVDRLRFQSADKSGANVGLSFADHQRGVTASAHRTTSQYFADAQQPRHRIVHRVVTNRRRPGKHGGRILRRHQRR